MVGRSVPIRAGMATESRKNGFARPNEKRSFGHYLILRLLGFQLHCLDDPSDTVFGY